MQIPLVLTLKISIMQSEIFWFNRISPNQRVNEMEQEEQEDEYITSLNNF